MLALYKIVADKLTESGYKKPIAYNEKGFSCPGITFHCFGNGVNSVKIALGYSDIVENGKATILKGSLSDIADLIIMYFIR